MKEIVTVVLATDPKTGAILPDAPFLVAAPTAERSSVYESEPEVIAQFAPGGLLARFEAEWTDEGRKLRRRVAVAKSYGFVKARLTARRRAGANFRADLAKPVSLA